MAEPSVVRNVVKSGWSAGGGQGKRDLRSFFWSEVVRRNMLVASDHHQWTHFRIHNSLSVQLSNLSIQEEFVDNSLEYFNDIHLFNEKLMDYLVYYTQIRPHKSLGNLAPLGCPVSKGIFSQMCVTSTVG